ncbi:hypothetical protein BSKO_09454 [Bryopsis sp. KO-2023]|nr:hypothetical protein BSKO_09454 [Bryopsis sp. KO-2023]
MASSVCQTPAVAFPIASLARVSKPRRGVPSLNAVPKKLNTLDEGYKKTWFGQGYFKEDKEQASVNVYENIEKKGLLSSVEKAGLLTALEKNGLSLTKIEEMGLLSTAENLGVLSLAEKALQSDPGSVSSLAIPFIVASILALVYIPGDNLVESIVRYGAAGAFATGATALFAGGFALAYLQEEES